MTIIKDLFNTFRMIRNPQMKDWSSQWLKMKEMNILARGGDTLTNPAANSYIINKCVTIISQNFPAAPLVLFRGSKGDPIPFESSEYDLFKKPNEQMSSFDLWSATSLFFTLYGESFWFMNPSVGQIIGTRRAPAEIIVVDPRAMKVVLNEDKTLKGWLYNNDISFTKDEIIHFKNNNPYNPYRGLSPLDAVKIEANTDFKASKYQEAFFVNGAVPSIVIKTPEEDDTSITELRKIARLWDQRHKGSSKAHKTAVMRGGMSFETVGLSQQEMDFIDSRNFTRDLILSVFGVPKVMAGFTEGINRATAETQIRVFWQETMKPQLLRVQAKLNSDFFSRFYPGVIGRFDFRKVDELQKEFGDDIKAAKDLFQMGFSRNELNQRFDLGFEEDSEIGNDKYVPLNLVPADVDIYEDQNREEEPGTELPVPGQAERSVKANKQDIIDSRIIELFRRNHAKLEKLLAPKIKLFFYNQRSKMLKLINNEEKGIKDDPYELIGISSSIQQSETDRFIKAMTPFVSESILTGENMALTALGLDLETAVNKALVMSRMGIFKTVNDTVFKQIKKQIFEGIKAGETITDIADRIKQTYNKVNTRATLIARTEVTAAVNSGQMSVYASQGIKFKRWLTARDERVREAHLSNSRQDAIPIGAAFGNGEQFPGQSSVNCRCTLIYSMDEESN